MSDNGAQGRVIMEWDRQHKQWESGLEEAIGRLKEEWARKEPVPPRFEGIEAEGADLSGLSAPNMIFCGARLSRANLSGADLQRGRWEEADLSGANLSGANLEKVTLEKANLSGANLSGADLRGAAFEGANLRGANFTGANLTDAGFDDATDLTGVIWGGAKLSCVHGLPQKILDLAEGIESSDPETKDPET